MAIKPIKELKPSSRNAVHENPLLNRIYQNRGVVSGDELKYELNRLLHPNLMKGMKEASEVLTRHIKSDSKILVVGDYDCDGATATTIAVEGLRKLGGKNVEFLIPDRKKHGYGLTPAIVEVAGECKPDLIVTVDNGITSFDGSNAVYELNHPCELLITDHHLAPEVGLPRAEAIVNPNQPGCKFPSKNIAGCGVMFYVILGLRAYLREQGEYKNKKEPCLETMLDVLALGTIADVVGLDQNNRILVSAGLKYMNKGNIRAGMRHVAELKKRTVGNLVASDMGFAIGPCLNAAGRLDDMSLGIRCLLERDEDKALEYAKILNNLNNTRREMEQGMVELAVEAIDQAQQQKDRRGICLFEPTWHEGVIGIVASRIKERMNRPVICMTDTHGATDVREKIRIAEEKSDDVATETLKIDLNEELIKGSCRSVPKIHLKHLLDKINKDHPNILAGYGGHAMAAGLSLKLKHLEKFKELFDEYVSRELTADMILGEIVVDIKNIPSDWITLDNAELIRKSGPWGQKFEQPVFSQVFDVIETRVLCDKHLKLKVRVPGEAFIFDAISFNCVEDGIIPVGDKVEASFTLDVNEYRERKNLQLMIQELQDPSYTINTEKPKSVNLKGTALKQKERSQSISF